MNYIDPLGLSFDEWLNTSDYKALKEGAEKFQNSINRTRKKLQDKATSPKMRKVYRNHIKRFKHRLKRVEPKLAKCRSSSPISILDIESQDTFTKFLRDHFEFAKDYETAQETVDRFDREKQQSQIQRDKPLKGNSAQDRWNEFDNRR